MARTLAAARLPLALVTVLLVAVALRLPNYCQSIWFDEACMSTQRTGTWAQLLTTAYVDIHPPFYITFMYLWNAVFGDSEVSMRLPALLCGLASIPLVFTVGDRLLGRRAAWWAVLLMCLSPVHIWYSIEARHYTLMVFLTLAAVMLFQRLLDGRRSRGAWRLYVVVLLLMLVVHYYLAVYVLLLGLLGALAARREAEREVGRRIAIVHAVLLVLLAGWVAVRMSLAELETSQGYMRAFTFEELYRFLFQWSWTGNCLPAGLRHASWNPRWVLWVLFQILGVALFLRGLVVVLRSNRTKPEGSRVLLYMLAVPVFLLVLPGLGLANTYVERSALPALPFFLLVVGAGLASLTVRWVRVAASAMVLAMCAANLTAYYVYDDEWTVYKPHPDWRSTARYLGAEVDAGGGGRPVFTSMPNPRSLSYYDRRIQFEPGLVPMTARTEQMVRTLERKLGPCLGGALARVAQATAREFERGKAEARAGAELLVHRVGDGRLSALKLGERRLDGIFYVVKNRWHPPRDEAVPRLVTDPRLRVLETVEYGGVTVYKVQEGN